MWLVFLDLTLVLVTLVHIVLDSLVTNKCWPEWPLKGRSPNIKKFIKVWEPYHKSRAPLPTALRVCVFLYQHLIMLWNIEKIKLLLYIISRFQNVIYMWYNCCVICFCNIIIMGGRKKLLLGSFGKHLSAIQCGK